MSKCLGTTECRCSKCYSRIYYITHREKILAYQRKYYYETSNPRHRRTPKAEKKVIIDNGSFTISFK